MGSILIYIFQTAICLSLFFSVYFFLLRRMTFFGLNRFFLLAGIFASVLLPTLPYSYDVEIDASEMKAVTNYIPLGKAKHAHAGQLNDGDKMIFDFDISVWLVIGAVYASGAIFIFGSNMNTLRRLYQLKKSGRSYCIDNQKIIHNAQVKTPFSFFSDIYINLDKMEAKEQEIIIKHEAAHIEQKHWFDLFIGELMLTFMWFNPLMWYYIYLMKENHEYLVDRAILKNGESIDVYRAVLINQRFQGQVFSFTNSFNFSGCKNRLSMMDKEKTSSWKRMAILAIIPLVGVYATLSAKPHYIEKTNTEILENEVKTDTAWIYQNPINGISYKELEYGKEPNKKYFLIARTKDGKEEKIELRIDTIELKNDKNKISAYSTGFRPFLIPYKRLMFLDDIEYEKDDPKLVRGLNDPKVKIKVKILSPEEGFKLYGERGKNGVNLYRTIHISEKK